MKIPKLLREWDGLRVRLIGRHLQTKGGDIATKGAVGHIRTSGTKAGFECTPCQHCKLSFLVRGLSKDDLPLLFEILPPEAPTTTRIDEDTCKFCETKFADTICDTCSRPCCSECGTMIDGGICCPTCFEEAG